MKCRKCNKAAVVNMRQHKLALCEAHFLDWLPEQTQRTIEKYRMFTPDDKILVAVSGGKDSLSVWDILLRLSYHADAMTIQLGIDEGIGYSDESHRYIERFIRNFYPNSVLHTVNVRETYGLSIPEVARKNDRGRGRPCSVCGLIKRHEMNRIAYELGYSVLVTGHNLDDEASVLWGNMLNWEIESLTRQSPVLPADPHSHSAALRGLACATQWGTCRSGLARKVKPLCRFYERDMAAYAFLRGIEYIYEECPFSIGARSLRNKEVLNQMELDQPGLKQQFYIGFLNAKERGLFTTTDQVVVELHECEGCGQPTSTQGLCAFCKLWSHSSEAEASAGSNGADEAG